MKLHAFSDDLMRRVVRARHDLLRITLQKFTINLFWSVLFTYPPSNRDVIGVAIVFLQLSKFVTNVTRRTTTYTQNAHTQKENDLTLSFLLFRFPPLSFYVITCTRLRSKNNHRIQHLPCRSSVFFGWAVGVMQIDRKDYVRKNFKLQRQFCLH